MKETKVKTVNWHRRQSEHLTLGQRAADRMRNYLGSWFFVFSFLLFMLAWMGWNVYAPKQDQFDIMPFIFLNLMLSTLAGLQGGILLIAAKRQDEISQALAENDFQINRASKKEIEALQKAIARIENEKLDEILAVLKAKKK